jgi:hypothetical protein
MDFFTGLQRAKKNGTLIVACDRDISVVYLAVAVIVVKIYSIAWLGEPHPLVEPYDSFRWNIVTTDTLHPKAVPETRRGIYDLDILFPRGERAHREHFYDKITEQYTQLGGTVIIIQCNKYESHQRNGQSAR